MDESLNNLNNVSVTRIDKELIARGAGKFIIPLSGKGRPLLQNLNPDYRYLHSSDPALQQFTEQELIETLRRRVIHIKESREYTKYAGPHLQAPGTSQRHCKAIWFSDDRLDAWQIASQPILENSLSVAAVCLDEDLIQNSDGSFAIDTENYREMYNLSPDEPFGEQPAAAGRLFTAFLVTPQIAATAGHCIETGQEQNLRFIFGYRLDRTLKPVQQVYAENVFRVVEVIHRAFDRREPTSDWALVKLDRPAYRRTTVRLSERDAEPGRTAYVLGHPLGLPLKYAPGAKISGAGPGWFSAPIDVYCGSSGSPVFDSETHCVIGLVARGDERDFRWTERGWVSVIYPESHNPSSQPQCTHVSQFSRYCR